MNYADPLMLAPGVQLLPISKMSTAFRRMTAARAGDHALAYPGSRRTARVINAPLAALLREFRRPTTIVHAIAAAGPALGVAERQLLDDAFPFLQRLINEGLLVTEQAAAAARLGARYRAGDRIGEWRVRSCLLRLQDTELYRVRAPDRPPAVVKLARRERGMLGSLDTEARLLGQIGGDVAPRLLGRGIADGLPYLVMEWRPGVNAALAAADARIASRHAPQIAVARLAAHVARAYARLHARGVVHGDVHEANVLVDATESVTLVDFGLGRALDDPAPRRVVRGGHAFYMEPEFARARLAGHDLPVPTPASDQYALAAMIYHLLTGAQYLDFRLAGAEAYAQIASEPVRPFAESGTATWPQLERVLSRALAKAPEARFVDCAAFADGLEEAIAADVRQSPRRPARRAGDLTARFVERVSSPRASDRRQLMQAPTASVMHGAAGVAYALLRLAALRDDAELLARADAWIVDARAAAGRPDAWHDESELTRNAVRACSLYHGRSGAEVVQALVSHALGDFVTMRDAVRAIVAIGNRADRHFDLSLGLPGVLLGACLVLETRADTSTVDVDGLQRAGARWHARVVAALDGPRRLDRDRARVNLGIAHGWAGALYAALRWADAAGVTTPDVVRRRLDELAAAGDRFGRGMRWAWRQRVTGGRTTAGYMPGWCNGTAGFVHLWIQAHRVTRDERYLDLAELAAWDTWQGRDESSPNLCCGLAGQGYALLAWARATGDAAWARRAWNLAERAGAQYARADTAPPALFKGAAGGALLLAEADDPDRARAPLFEPEGWPQSHAPR